MIVIELKQLFKGSKNESILYISIKVKTVQVTSDKHNKTESNNFLVYGLVI